MCLSLVIIQWFKTDSPKPQLLLYQSNKILHASQSGQKKGKKKSNIQQTRNRREVPQLDKEYITKILQLFNDEKLDVFPLKLGTRQDVHSHHS